jgi:phage baseplate assembly protein W
MAINQINRQPDYSDLDLLFVNNPATNDIGVVRGEASIKRSIGNLLKTNFYEKPFRPEVGSGVTSLLFEPSTTSSQIVLERAIKLCIDNHEPRVRLQNVEVSYDEDEYGFKVRLEYVILNNNLPVVSTLFLERIRS